VTTASDRPIDAALASKLKRLGDEGWEIWCRFDREVRHHRWHPFVPGEYDRVLSALTELWRPGTRFLEMGSATGVIAIMADLLGYEAYGIEIDEDLVRTARDIAGRYGSRARFATGSFLPQGYVWRPSDGDGRPGTIGEGPSGYTELALPLDEFGLVYAYPWGGEEAMFMDLMRRHGASDAGFLLQLTSGELRLLRSSRVERFWAHRP